MPSETSQHAAPRTTQRRNTRTRDAENDTYHIRTHHFYEIDLPAEDSQHHSVVAVGMAVRIVVLFETEGNIEFQDDPPPVKLVDSTNKLVETRVDVLFVNSTLPRHLKVCVS